MRVNMLTTEEAAYRIGFAPKTLAKMRVTGSGPAFHKVGRSVRYAVEDLESWLASRRRISTSQVC
jgi:hypothetical protein